MELLQKPTEWQPGRMAWAFLTVLVAITIAGMAFEVVARRRRKAYIAVLDKKISEIQERDAALKATQTTASEPPPAPAPEPDKTGAESALEPAASELLNLPRPKISFYEMPIVPAGLHFTIQPMPSPDASTTIFRAWSNNQRFFVEVINDQAALVGDFRAKNNVYVPALVFRAHEVTEGDPPSRLLQETYIPTESNPDSKSIAAAIRTLLDSVQPKTA